MPYTWRQRTEPGSSGCVRTACFRWSLSKGGSGSRTFTFLRRIIGFEASRAGLVAERWLWTPFRIFEVRLDAGAPTVPHLNAAAGTLWLNVDVSHWLYVAAGGDLPPCPAHAGRFRGPSCGPRRGVGLRGPSASVRSVDPAMQVEADTVWTTEGRRAPPTVHFEIPSIRKECAMRY